jgi:hypothetical protein
VSRAAFAHEVDSARAVDGRLTSKGVNRGAGSAIDPGIRAPLERAFSHDFGSVRIFADARSGEAATALESAAFTHGNTIVFGPGFYQPATPLGHRILTHELAHVVQQSRGGSQEPGPSHERDAESACRAVREGSAARVTRTSRQGIARFGLEDLKEAGLSFVPDSLKEYVAPVAEEAEAKIKAILPPLPELPPKLVEFVEDRVQSAKSSVAETVDEVKQAVQQSADTVTAVKAQVKRVVHDKVLGSVGVAKGVAMQATDMVDTLASVPVIIHKLEEKHLGSDTAAKAVIAMSDVLTNYTLLKTANDLGIGILDPKTGQPALSEKLGAVLDTGIDKLDSALGGSNMAQIFTPQEVGELAGGIGTQAALAAVGAEEAKLALKVIGIIGSAETIINAIDADPKGFYKQAAFWGAIINAVLLTFGFRGRLASKIEKLLLATDALLGAVPAIQKFYTDYKASNDPDRDEKMKQDWSAIIKVIANAVMVMAQHARKAGSGNEAGAKTGAESAEPQAREGTLPVETAGEAAAPATEPAAPSEPAKIRADAPQQIESAPVHAAAEPAPPEGTPAPPKIAAPQPDITPEVTAPAPTEGAAVDAKAPPTATTAADESAMESAQHAQRGDPAENAAPRSGAKQTPTPEIAPSEPTAVNAGVPPPQIEPAPAAEPALPEAKDAAKTPVAAQQTATPEFAGPRESAAVRDRTMTREQWKAREGARRWKAAVDKAFEGDIVEEASVPRVRGGPKSGYRIGGTKVPSEPQARIDIQAEATVRDASLPTREGETAREAVARVRSVIGKKISDFKEPTDHPQGSSPAQVVAIKNRHAVYELWNEARASILSRRALTSDNYAELYDATRDAFWRRVNGKTPKALAAREAFSDAGLGWEPGDAGAPKLLGIDSKLKSAESVVSLDHNLEKAQGDNWKNALDPENLTFEFAMPNTMRENLQMRHPELRALAQGKE